MAKHWADFQYEIYLNGMSGAVPSHRPACAETKGPSPFMTSG